MSLRKGGRRFCRGPLSRGGVESTDCCCCCLHLQQKWYRQAFMTSRRLRAARDLLAVGYTGGKVHAREFSAA